MLVSLAFVLYAFRPINQVAILENCQKVLLKLIYFQPK